MADRQQIEREMKEKLDEGESVYQSLKAKADAVGDEISDEAREALRNAETMLEKGKMKMQQLADAADDEFDEVWAETKEEWHEVQDHIADGWSKFTHGVKEFFT